jgi:hypothetical protein
MAEPMSVAFEIPAAFVLAEDVPMTAEDLGYGFERGFLKAADVVALATHEVGRGIDDDVLVALGSLLRDEVGRVPEVLELLDDPERVHDPRESVCKWLYLQLKAAYDERGRLSDLLGVAEEIYADVDYPPAVASFIRRLSRRSCATCRCGQAMSQALALSWTGGGTTWLVRERRFAGGRPAALDQPWPPARALRRLATSPSMMLRTARAAGGVLQL